MTKIIFGISFSLFILFSGGIHAVAATCTPACSADKVCEESFDNIDDPTAPTGNVCMSKEKASAGIPKEYPEKATLDAVETRINSFPSEMEKDVNINLFVGRALRVFLGIIGTVALLVFLYSGIMWMTAGGEPKKVTDAQHTMVWAALGLFAIFISYAAVSYMIKAFTF